MFEPDDAMTYWGFILSLAATFHGEINFQFNKGLQTKLYVVHPACLEVS